MPRPIFLLATVLSLAFPLAAVHAKQPKATPAKKPATADASVKKASDSGKISEEDAVRLQIFLDRVNFGPGKIDGAYGGFTKVAWQKYQASHGITPPKDTFDPKDPLFAEVGEPFTEYTITAADLAGIGTVPSSPPEQAKLKSLPYTSLSEAIGEKFHAGAEFLKRLNAPKKFDSLKAGDTVKVPNVQPPFDLARVIAMRGGKPLETEKARNERLAREKDKKPTGNANAAASPAPSAAPAETTPAPDRTSELAIPVLSPAAYVHISTKECLLELRDGDKLVAAFPITPGSKSIPTPVGTWKIVAKTLMPTFRWDNEMLMRGKRSDTAYELPPGPNNPVGITWIALNRPGIGMHGTTSPDTIGRSASHGCIRLANWDAFKLYGMVDKGLKVVIE